MSPGWCATRCAPGLFPANHSRRTYTKVIRTYAVGVLTGGLEGECPPRIFPFRRCRTTLSSYTAETWSLRGGWPPPTPYCVSSMIMACGSMVCFCWSFRQSRRKRPASVQQPRVFHRTSQEIPTDACRAAALYCIPEHTSARTGCRCRRGQSQRMLAGSWGVARYNLDRQIAPLALTGTFGRTELGWRTHIKLTMFDHPNAENVHRTVR